MEKNSATTKKTRRSKTERDEKKGRFVFYSLNPDTYRNSDKGEVITLGPCRLEISK